MTISEVSKKYNISTETLRYYERVGIIPTVTRNENGIRNYTEIDCNWVNFVKCMRGAGVSIDNLVLYTRLFLKGKDTMSERKQILINQREEIKKKIENMEIALDRLNKKIDGYEDIMLKYENEKLN